MATNYGIGHEGIWSGLGQYSFDGWQPFAGSVTEEQKLQILNDMCDHILINGKTMSEIRVENGKSAEISTAVGGTAMGRVIFGYYGEKSHSVSIRRPETAPVSLRRRSRR